MSQVLLNTGLLSASLWLGVIALSSVVLSWWREHGRSRPPALVSARFSSTLFLVFLSVGAVVNVGYGVLKGFLAPRDILQDIIAADEYRAGRSLYPAGMDDKMVERMAREPDLIGESPLPDNIKQRLREHRNEGLHGNWVQAHPPLMTLLVAPFVGGGVWFTQLVMLLASLAGVGISVALLMRGLALELTPRQQLMFVLAVLLAEPVVMALRLGQSGLILTALIIAGWYALKRNRPLLSGMAIGLAASIKMFPGLLLIYLLCRQRRAFFAAVGTILFLAAFVGLLAGWECFGEFRATTQGVVRQYGDFPGNLSLLALVSHLGGPGGTSDMELAFFVGVASVIVGTIVWRLWRLGRQPGQGELLDLEYALCVALMPLLSPIAWDHFLVVMLLPMAVLGWRALNNSASWSATLLYLGLGAILLIPETTFTWPYELTHNRGGRLLEALFVLPLRSYAMILLCVWLGRLARREAGIRPPLDPAN